MPFNVFSKKTTQQHDPYVVALDIGTEFVKALIAEIDGDDIKIIGVGRTQQDESDMHSGAIANIDGVVRTCEDALAQAEEQAGLQAKRAVIGVAGELVKGVTNTIKYRRPQPDTPLDDREMELIIRKVQERAQQNAQEQIALETGNDDVEVRLVNSALVSIHIDGYKITNPIGFQGKDVSVQIYTAFAPMVHIGALERVADQVALDLVAVAAEPFAVSRSVLGNDANSSFTAILIDVGGGTTDIAVVNDGGVEGTRMFGIGGRSFTRTIANEMELSHEDAETLKRNYGHERLNLEVKKQLKNAIDTTMSVWVDGVELGLSEFESVDHLPSKILLCGGGASLDPVIDALARREWYGDLPFTKRPKVQRIDPHDVKGITDTTDTITDHTYITAMGLLRVGYDTIESGADDPSVQRMLNRILKV